MGLRHAVHEKDVSKSDLLPADTAAPSQRVVVAAAAVVVLAAAACVAVGRQNILIM